MRASRLLVAISFLVFLTSCVTADPRLVSVLRETTVTQIRVETAPDVSMGGFDRTHPDPQLPAVVHALDNSLNREVRGVPGGKNAGRLIVTLHVVDVSSKAGRIIAGNDSYISGTVRLEDAKTGRLIAEAQNIRGEDKGIRGDGEIGIVIAMAINAAQVAEKEDALAQRLSDAFSRNVKAWLTQK